MDEAHLRLAVLAKKLPRGVGLPEPPFDVPVHAGLGQDVLHDVDRALVLEDARALAVLERGQGRAEPEVEEEGAATLRQEADACQVQLRQLQADLREFEQKYQQSSAEFYQQFQAGQTSDAMDYVEWASLIQMADNLTKRLRLLRGEASG